MQLAFKYGSTAVHFQVVFRKRKSMTIMVEAPDKVTVIVPLGTRQAIIMERVQAKAPWIIKKLEYFKNTQQLYNPKNFRNGESFLYLGEDYQLQVEEELSFGRIEVKLDGNRLRVFVPFREEGIIAMALEAWYRQQAKQKILERVGFFQNRLPQLPNRIVIKDQKHRWGSCSSKGNLNFNWRLVMAPLVIIDYIVVHEMCHLVHLNHSKDFWNLVGEILPDYQEMKKWLKINGAQLRI